VGLTIAVKIVFKDLAFIHLLNRDKLSILRETFLLMVLKWYLNVKSSSIYNTRYLKTVTRLILCCGLPWMSISLIIKLRSRSTSDNKDWCYTFGTSVTSFCYSFGASPLGSGPVCFTHSTNLLDASSSLLSWLQLLPPITQSQFRLAERLKKHVVVLWCTLCVKEDKK